MKAWKSLGLAVSLTSAALGGACSAANDPVATGGGDIATGTTGTGGPANTGGFGGGFGEGGFVPMGQPIVIEPATFTLNVDSTNIVTQPITATIDGQDVTASVTWSFEKPYIGDVANGAFVPTGNAGGVGKITAVLGTSYGEAEATVYTVKTVGGAAIDPGVKTALDDPMGPADPDIDWMYPYDQTVYPLDVLGPELMWNGTGSGDVYKLRIVEKYLDYTAYFTAAPPSRHLIPDDDWAHIGRSGTGAQSDPLVVTLGRYANGTAYQPEERTWRIAQGKLKGVVYYWELPAGAGNGRILRIKPSSPVVEEFYQPGGCWGCHTVSRNGQRMMATLDNGSPFPQFTLDLTSDPATPTGIFTQSGLGGTFGAFNDKGDRLILSNDDPSSGSKLLTIVDANTSAALMGNVMGTGCGEPAWSPDGTKLAAICGLSGGGWVFDITTGHLDVADVAADGFTVTNQQTIIPQAGFPGRPAYPSFAPGSEYIAYGRPTQGSRSTGDGTLWLTDLTGTNVKQLVEATRGDNQSFNPVFAPLRAGGYYWLVYISRRDYGNRLVGADRQQLWITAIDDPPTADDPSHPPFYLRGQEESGKSENAYFALEPCKEVGESCESGVDCCTGTCLKDPNTDVYTCATPQDCSLDGNACKTADDCCNPASLCIDGFCAPDVPR